MVTVIVFLLFFLVILADCGIGNMPPVGHNVNYQKWDIWGETVQWEITLFDPTDREFFPEITMEDIMTCHCISPDIGIQTIRQINKTRWLAGQYVGLGLIPKGGLLMVNGTNYSIITDLVSETHSNLITIQMQD